MKIFDNYNIKNESTFRIGGIVRKVAFPESVQELLSIINDYDIILGNCSNVLFSSDYINKKIIITKLMDKYKIMSNTVYAECGVKGPIIAKEAAKNNLSGFEFLVGFPGSIGGIVYMNASAHKQSISDTFLRARVYDREINRVLYFSKNEMHFDYRKSVLSEGRYVLLDSEFELISKRNEEIIEQMQSNIEFRKNRQPSLSFGNAGSIFKNPASDSAGRLLDLCGFKGQKYGGAMVFDNHANFIINYENATSKDVLTLMNKMYLNVKEKFAIELKPEIIYIGDSNTEEYKLWETMAENT